METNIKLYGTKSERFLEIKREVAEALGYEPSNSEVVGLLMAGYDPNESPVPQSVHRN